jgi:hypothetical protein
MKPVKHEVVVKIPEEVEDMIDRIGDHFDVYKKFYFTGIGGFVLGYILRKPKMITIVNEIKIGE